MWTKRYGMNLCKIVKSNINYVFYYRRLIISCLVTVVFFTYPANSLKFPFPKFKFKCSAGMVCVDENLCDQFGVISPNPVTLTPEQEEFRMPLLPCKKKEGGLGACCRDPNYKDDWPSSPGIPSTTRRVTQTSPPTKSRIVTDTPIVTPTRPTVTIPDTTRVTRTTPKVTQRTASPPPLGPIQVLAATGCPYRRRVSL